jgi:hypothetical protein
MPQAVRWRCGGTAASGTGGWRRRQEASEGDRDADSEGLEEVVCVAGGRGAEDCRQRGSETGAGREARRRRRRRRREHRRAIETATPPTAPRQTIAVAQAPKPTKRAPEAREAASVARRAAAARGREKRDMRILRAQSEAATEESLSNSSISVPAGAAPTIAPSLTRPSSPCHRRVAGGGKRRRTSSHTPVSLGRECAATRRTPSPARQGGGGEEESRRCLAPRLRGPTARRGRRGRAGRGRDPLRRRPRPQRRSPRGSAAARRARSTRPASARR